MQCYRCGNKDHIATECQIAKDKICFNCGKQGHLKTVCKSARNPSKTTPKGSIRYVVADESSSDDDFVLMIKSANKGNIPCPVLIDGHKTDMLIDSGSTVNVISSQTLHSVGLKPKMEPFRKKVYAFGTTSPLPFQQCFHATITTGNHQTKAKFIVNPQPCTTILGHNTALQLNLLRVGPPVDAENDKVHQLLVQQTQSTEMNQLLEEYSDRFKGLGKLKDVSLKIQVDSSVTPIAQKARRLPILMQPQVNTELERLLELGVIEPVSKPPTWVNPIVVVPKKDPGSIRMCVDMRAANTSIIREPYQIPTLEELIHEYNGCTVFTKLDLNKGYHQIELDEESRYLTAFATHKGIFRYTRLLFGMSSAAELYQKEIEHALSGIPGVRNISDDIIIGGRNDEELISRTRSVFQRLRTKNLTVNPSKCEFLKPELLYMGHKLSSNGISPDEQKIKAIVDLLPPSNQKELRSFLGMITYCSKFLPNFAIITEPLRNLLKKDVPWEWNRQHQNTFVKLKEILLNSESLSYFDGSAYTEISTDASPVGVGAVLMQMQSDGTMRPVSYASRSLSAVEQRYSQLERECLAVVFAIERFRLYLYGIKFTVKTDHKPLVHIFSSPNKTITPRIERFVIRAMPYNYKVEYQPGKLNGADYLSRSNHTTPSSTKRNMAEESMQYVYQNAMPQSISAETISHEQKKDSDICSAIESIKKGNLSPQSPFFTVRHGLTTDNDILMLNDKIIIPPSLQLQLISIAHEGHQGIVRTKQRLRQKTWWPGFGRHVETFIKSCHGCQVVGPPPKPTPLSTTKLPKDSWLLLGCDLVGPFPSDENLLVCVDYYSRYPEVEILNNISSKAIATKLRKLFCRYGAPECIVTDNGPQFRKHTEFRELMKEFNVRHRKVTAYNPRANGEVERFNRNLKKTIQASVAEGQNWRVTLDNFLLSYRTTPHSITGKTPAELMFGRNIRDKIPGMNQSSFDRHNVRKRDRQKKMEGKRYFDTKNKSKPHSINVGDEVLTTNVNPKRNKLTPRWNTNPGTVIQVKGNSLIISQGSKRKMRSADQAKPYNRSRSYSCSFTTESSSEEDFLPSREDDVVTNNDVLSDVATNNDVQSDVAINNNTAVPTLPDVATNNNTDVLLPDVATNNNINALTDVATKDNAVSSEESDDDNTEFSSDSTIVNEGYRHEPSSDDTIPYEEEDGTLFVPRRNRRLPRRFDEYQMT